MLSWLLCQLLSSVYLLQWCSASRCRSRSRSHLKHTRARDKPSSVSLSGSLDLTFWLSPFSLPLRLASLLLARLRPFPRAIVFSLSRSCSGSYSLSSTPHWRRPIQFACIFLYMRPARGQPSAFLTCASIVLRISSPTSLSTFDHRYVIFRYNYLLPLLALQQLVSYFGFSDFLPLTAPEFFHECRPTTHATLIDIDRYTWYARAPLGLLLSVRHFRVALARGAFFSASVNYPRPS